MKDKELLRAKTKKTSIQSAKECAYIAVFVAILIAAQVALSFVPGVELVTVFFVTYSFVMGIKRGVISAFALLRQLVFGFAPTVLILYLIYFPLLTFIFGVLGSKIKKPLKLLPLIVLVACVCTAIFTMLDNVITPVWYGYGQKSAKLYFMASIPFMIPQVICTLISVSVLFFPLYKAFNSIKIVVSNDL